MVIYFKKFYQLNLFLLSVNSKKLYVETLNKTMTPPIKVLEEIISSKNIQTQKGPKQNSSNINNETSEA